MYNDYIDEKKQEKIEYDLNLFKEYLIIYINLLIKFPNELELRTKLTEFIKDYYSYSKREYQLLNRIKKINDDNLEEKCCLILEKLENIFLVQFNYNEDVLNGYEEAIFYKDIDRAYFRQKNISNSFNEQYKDFIKKIICKKE